MRKKKTQQIGDIISEWMQEEPSMHEQVVATEAVHAFKLMMGPLGQEIRSAYIHERTLFVRIASSAVREELHQRREQLAKRLNEAVNAAIVDQIIFR